ncbi:MAG: hypothetical protein KatS3mg038_3894 [Candidatus Kapaibacterium sp.]|nr:MAG: hypothetical protein KatS3mg038_3894 [Candidatus Kapabacteria bacterium]GIV55534.1 MAG: hypothetical protein KatS3mg040_0302 [Candidatus Kapabacteria bacterium]
MQRFIVLGLVAFGIVHAADTTSTLWENVWGDIRSVPSGIAIEPLPSIATSAGSLAAIVWMSGGDRALRSAALRNQHRTLDALAQVGNALGQSWSAAALSAAIIAGGTITGSEHTVTSGRQLLEALAVAGFITTATKIAVGRARPWRNRGDGFFLPARWDDGQWSFPSGHATIGGTILGVALARGQSVTLHVGAAAVAFTIAWARIYSDQHWVSDVIAGTTIGATVGYALARRMHSSAQWQLYPLPNGIGIGAAW